MEKGERSIGAIWKTKSKAGAEYFSVQVEIEGKKYKLVAFPNKFKENDTHPDYKMYVSTPPVAQSTSAARPVAKTAPVEVETEEVEADDTIPF